MVDTIQNLKTVQFRHLNVEENQVRLLLVDFLHRIRTVIGTIHNFNGVFVLRQKTLQTLQRQRFVVD